MNKNLYRVIFHKTLGRMVVVAECAKNQGKSRHTVSVSSGSNTQPSSSIFQKSASILTLSVWTILASLGFMSSNYAHGQTQIIADKTAPKIEQPVIIATANGLTQVNIQTPSQAGVSKNQYSQFDVSQQGAILNNSRTHVKTQLAGFVEANPYLARGEARVILNQVNSNHPSQLKGYVEVAGKRAEVVIANPSGIQVNGGGFINAQGTVLTTGQARFDGQGNITHYDISQTNSNGQQGKIQIDGKGFNNSEADYTKLISQYNQLNAQVFAGQGDLEVQTGTQLDVSKLGGMYAGKIRLVGTEKGFGVNNQGVIASVGNGVEHGLVLDSKGNLINTGSISAKKQVQINTTAIDNTGTISSEQANIAITTNHLSNQGTIHSTQTNRINTDNTMNNQGEIYGGVLEVTTDNISNTGKLIQTGSGNLDITIETLTNQDKAVIGQNLYTSTKVDKVNTPSTAQAGGGVSTNQNSTPTNTNTNSHTPAPTTGIMTTPTHNGFITANKTLQNTGDTALITANGSIEVTSNKTINQNQASIDVEKLNTNHLNNIDSKIALDSVNWQLEQFDNTQGSLSAKTQISIDSQSNIINQQGKLISGGDIRLNAQTHLDNNQGTIQAKANTQLQGIDLYNKQGTITGKHISLQINDVLDNKGGQVFAHDTLEITNSSDKNLTATTVIDNTQGKLLSENLLNVKAKTLHNQGEIASPMVQISTIDDLTHDNKDTLIANQLSLTSQGSIHNKDRLVAGNQLSLNANHLHNSENATINAQIAQINITSNLTNQGLIHADNLTISAETLQNLGAKIYGTDVNINANTLINQGANKGAIIASQNSLDIGVNKLINQHGNTIHSNATDNAWLLSLGSLNIHGKDGKKTADSITNLGARIESGTDMQLLADKISNRNANFSSEVQAIENSERPKEYITPQHSSQKIDVNVLDWRPWSKAGYYTYKNANALEVNLNNLGKAPIASLYTCQNEENCGLNYDTDSAVWQYFKITPPDTPMPVITVDIPEPTLPTGESEESCKKNNASSACTTYLEQLKTYDKAVQPFKAWEEANLQKLEALEKAINEYNAQFGHPQFKNYTHIKVKEHEEQSVVITSAPAQIISGQKLAITANQVVNDKSHILASDKITVDSNNLNNINAEGVHRTIQEGTSQWTNSRWRGGFKRYHQRDWGAELPFKDIQETTITLPVTQYKEQMMPAELNQYKNNQIVINNANNTIGTASQINVPTNTVTGQSLVLPNSALYTINANNSNQPVIQTDPAFTNGKIWLGSDFMTDKLGHQADHIHKRLGDGYYEQQLIKDQIMALTGRRYLADHRNDDEQYRTLMDNAVTIAKPLNLRVGVALTAEQIAGLTTDIVWLVEQEVTLKDKNGQDYQQKVLVPKVYVRSKIADLTGTGNLISAQNVDVKLSGSLNNEGHIIAHQGLNIQADNINNQNTGVIKGDFVQLNARENINNIGGTIGADSAMNLTAGKDIKNIATTSQTHSQLGQSHSERTSIDRIAKIYVGNKNQDSNLTTLSINANGQYIAQAGQIDNAGGSSVINAKQGIELGATKTGYNINAIGDSNNYYKISEYQDVGSTITGKGNIVAVTQNDINATATTISSETGKVALIANGENSSINIKEGRHTESLDTAYLMKNKSLTSSKTTKGSYSHQTDQTISSQIDGKQVIISATQDVNLTAVQAISDEQTTIQAGRDVNITGAHNTASLTHQHETKKSGFTLSAKDGLASVGYAKNKNNTQLEQHSSSITSSLIGSKQGSTTIIADNQLNINASKVQAGQDIHLQGKQVELTAGSSYDYSQQSQQQSRSGFGVGVTYNPVKAFKTAYDRGAGAGQFSNNIIGKASAHGMGMLQGTMALAPVQITGGKSKASQTQTNEHNGIVSSELTAVGNITVVATDNSIITQGAKISAEQNTTLLAKQNIQLGYATQQQSQTAQQQNKGFSLDTRNGVAPLGTFKDQANGNNEQNSLVGTQVSVGGKLQAVAQTGQIDIIASQVVANQDVDLLAKQGINIVSASSHQQSHQQQSNKAIGGAVLSDTEYFMGQMRSQNQQDSQQSEQVRSQVGSLQGNVNMMATDGQYYQQSSDVIAKKDLNITAKSIKVEQATNLLDQQSSSKDKKIGTFSKISSPIITAIQSAEQASKSKADERTQALQGLAAVANGYQAYNAISNGGALVKAEVGLGVRTASHSQTIHQSSGQNNTLTGENIKLTSTDGDIDLNNTQLKADQTIDLNSSRDIRLTAGQSQHQLDGKNKSTGVAVGAGVSFGAQTGVYVYAEANQSKGKQHHDSLTHEHTTLNSKQLNITSKGDTTLKGAVANADRIDVNVGKTLTLTSVQDYTEQDTKQSSVGGRVQVSLGTAWDVSGNYAQSKGTGSSKQVHTQTALNADQGGFHITAGAVDLQAGAINSQADKNKNELITNKLTFSNMDNYSSYDVQSVSVNAGYGSKHQQANPNDSTAFQNTKLGQYFANTAGKQGLSSTPSLPQREKDKNHSTTYATLSDSKIIIAGKQTNVHELGIHSNSATANQQVNDLPDLAKIIEKQQIVQGATSDIGSAINTYTEQQRKEAEQAKKQAEQLYQQQLAQQQDGSLARYQALSPSEQRQELRNNSIAYQQAEQQYTSWSVGGDKNRALQTVSTIITSSLGGQGANQVVTQAVSPYTAYAIGQYFKHNEALNQRDLEQTGEKGTRAEQGSASHLLAHGLLAAATSYATGQSPETITATTLSTMGAEKLAPALGKLLYDTDKVADLTAEQKQTISNVLGTAGLVTGVVTAQATGADSISSVSAGQQVQNSVQNAVENNWTGTPEEMRYQAELDALWIEADGDKDKYYEGLQKIAERELLVLDILTLPLGISTKVARVGTGYAIKSGEKIISKTFESKDEAERALAYSIAQKAKLREDLAKQAGIPRDIIKKPSLVWGKTPEQIKQSFEMDGATVTKKPPKAKSSGNGQVYEVKDSASGIKEFEYHTGGGVHTPKGVFYYKIVKNDGTEIRIIDPSKPFNTGTIKQNQIYMDNFGNQIIFKNGKWEIKK